MSATVGLGDAAASFAAPPGRAPKSVAEVARQFEALMIAQLLKEARGDEGGWLGGGEDSGSATAAALAEEQFAQALASNGGLGLSAQITASLKPHPVTGPQTSR